MGKEKGFALSSVKTSQMRRFLERQGYMVQPGHHKHLKLKHETYADVLLPLKPSGNLSQRAVKQISAAMGLTPEELIQRAT
jgi:predicted RNA binding protein YcfA (HicA-like mRNA interferase family)